jgi:hypothetical protein
MNMAKKVKKYYRISLTFYSDCKGEYTEEYRFGLKHKKVSNYIFYRLNELIKDNKGTSKIINEQSDYELLHLVLPNRYSYDTWYTLKNIEYSLYTNINSFEFEGQYIVDVRKPKLDKLEVSNMGIKYNYDEGYYMFDMKNPEPLKPCEQVEKNFTMKK